MIRSLKAELSAFLPLFGPILISQYAQVANGVVDTAMAARLGPEALACVAMGVAWWMPIYMFVVGVLFGILVIISQYYGAGDTQNVRVAAWQGIWLGGFLGLCAMALLFLLTFGAPWLGAPEELIQGSQAYARMVMLGFPFGAAAVAIRFYCEGQGAVFPITVMTILTVGWNTLFNYLLMFGNFGFPALGVLGCGLATALSMAMFLVMALLYTGVSRRFANSRLLPVFVLPHFSMLKQIFCVGIPVGFSVTSDYLVLSVITMFIGSIGTIPVAAHQVTFSCTMLFFAVPAAVSFAASIRVGNLKGAGDAAKLRNSVSCILQACAGIGIFIAVVMYFNADTLALFFSKDPNVAIVSTGLIQIAAVFLFADGMQVCCNGILRGVGDTTVPFAISALSAWLVCIPLGYVLSSMTLPFGFVIPYEPFGVKGWWIALIASLSVASILLFLRVRKIFPKAEHVIFSICCAKNP